VTAGVAFFYLPWFWRAPDMWTVLVLFAVFAAAYLAPKRILHVRAAARQKRIAEEVPVFADLLRILFDVGLGMDQALVMIASENRETIPELSAELTAVIRQVAAGADRSDALSDMAAAIDVHDLTEVVALLRQIDRYGGAVQEPLLEFAGLLQDKRRTELQEKVGKLSGRMTVVMVLFLFPALLAIVGGPGFLAVIRALSRQ
jgi:tight adherence protein C